MEVFIFSKNFKLESLICKQNKKNNQNHMKID
jgi:hypothetical protein